MQIVLAVLSVVVGYLLGSVSMGVILTKVKYRRDVRSQGSGNAGATNVARTFGMKAGIFTLFGDVVKTVFAALIGYLLCGDVGLTAGLFGAIIGHCFPIYFGFKGGKGISVCLAIALCVDARIALISFPLFIIIVLISKIVSLGSIIAVISLPIGYIAINGLRMPQAAFMIFLPFLVSFMHRENIKRLIAGTEPKFFGNKK